jgi:signal transduction histidine kinase
MSTSQTGPDRPRRQLPLPPRLAEALLHSQEALVERWAERLGFEVGGAGRSARMWRDEMGYVIRLLAGSLGNRPEPEIAPPSKELPFAQLQAAYRGFLSPLSEIAAQGMGTKLTAAQVDSLGTAVEDVLAARLAAWVEERTNEFRVLADAQAKYISYVSHDLRGSLNGVVLMLEVLRGELEGYPQLRESMQDVALMRRSIQGTVALMDRHVRSDHLARGRIKPNPERTDLLALVESIVAEFAPAASAKRIRLSVDPPPDRVVWADAEIVRMVLRELLDNAVKYGSTGGDVRIALEHGDQEWALAVSDSGPGFSPERLEQFMDPLKRVELRERGLGLTLSRHAARAMGGRIVAATGDGGSSFTLIVPSAGAGD